MTNDTDIITRARWEQDIASAVGQGVAIGIRTGIDAWRLTVSAGLKSLPPTDLWAVVDSTMRAHPDAAPPPPLAAGEGTRGWLLDLLSADVTECL